MYFIKSMVNYVYLIYLPFGCTGFDVTDLVLAAVRVFVIGWSSTSSASSEYVRLINIFSYFIVDFIRIFVYIPFIVVVGVEEALK